MSSGVVDIVDLDAPTPPAAPPKPADNLMEQYGLMGVLAEMRSRKLRSSFMHYIPELPTDKVPLKPRCPAGTLMQIALQPMDEDEKVMELFDERVLRRALTLREGGKVQMPEWLDQEQSWGDEERKKRRKDRKKKKKKKKRKRDREDGDGKADDEDRKRKKRK